MKRLLTAIVTALSLAAVASSTAFAQTRWDLPSGYSPNTFQVQNLQWFAEEVTRATNGQLRITLHPGASLFRVPEIKRAVQTNQAPIGEFIISGAANENPLFGLDSIPFLATTYAEARRLNDISNPHLERLLARQGMKLLYTVPWPGQSLYSRTPLRSLADLRGTRMRAFSPATTRVADLVGAQPVTIQLADLPHALATGGVDNFLTSSVSGVDSRLYEHVRYFYEINAWLPRNAVVVNLRAFNALSAPVQAELVRVAREAGERGWRLSEQRNEEALRKLTAKGMNVDRASEGLRRELRQIGERMTNEWLQAAGQDGRAIIEAFHRR